MVNQLDFLWLKITASATGYSLNTSVQVGSFGEVWICWSHTNSTTFTIGIVYLHCFCFVTEEGTGVIKIRECLTFFAPNELVIPHRARVFS
jgi:hypothetical protein